MKFPDTVRILPLTVAPLTICCVWPHTAGADSVTHTINAEWVFPPPIFDLVSLPAVKSIDSIVIELAHVKGSEFVIYLDASELPNEMDFDLMFQESAGGNPNFSMGVVSNNGTLSNVASYTFVSSGGGAYSAPHTPSTTLNANAWISGSLPAQDYLLVIGDTFLFNGGAVGTWTINYTPLGKGSPGDVDGDGDVDVDDLLAVINAWGDCDKPPAPCPADVVESGTVDVDDLLLVINEWS